MRRLLSVSFCLLFCNDFLAGFLIDDLHRQANLATLVKAHELDPDLLAFLDHISGLGNAVAASCEM